MIDFGECPRYRPPYWHGENDVACHYFTGGDLIYADKIAKFIVRCNNASCESVIRRLEQVYTDVFIDECQDLAGWDCDFVELLLRSGIRLNIVGDPRQSILTTNLARKNRQYCKNGITELLERWEAQGLCMIESMNQTRRCNRAICDFANRLWADMEDMTPLSNVTTEHDGVFLVPESNLDEYLRRFRPQVLKHGKRKKAAEYERKGLNFGVAKGMECDRVLIVPTGPIKKFLKTGDASPLKEKDKLHVAITRARYSVAFVYDSTSVVVPNRWQ